MKFDSAEGTGLIDQLVCAPSRRRDAFRVKGLITIVESHGGRCFMFITRVATSGGALLAENGKH